MCIVFQTCICALNLLFVYFREWYSLKRGRVMWCRYDLSFVLMGIYTINSLCEKGNMDANDGHSDQSTFN